jgi:hypothetical protein
MVNLSGQKQNKNSRTELVSQSMGSVFTYIQFTHIIHIITQEKNVKKILLLIITLTSTSLLASKARLTALGEDTNGSFFIEDSRNIFLNPAFMNNFSSQLSFEYGNATTETASPAAEGGLILDKGNKKIGLYLGRISPETSEIIAESADIPGMNFYNPQNAIDLFYARSGTMDWGVGLHYANSSSVQAAAVEFPDSEATVMVLSGGVSTNKFSGYLHLGLTQKSNRDNAVANSDEFTGSNRLSLGGHYKLNDHAKLGLKVLANKIEVSEVTPQYEKSVSNFSVVYFSKIKTKNEVMNLFYTAGLASNSAVLNPNGSSVNSEESSLLLPISFGVEASIKEWMILRASIKQNTLINEDRVKTTTSDVTTKNEQNTVVSLGAGFKFGDFDFDAISAVTGTGDFNTMSLLTNISAAYKF